MSTTSLKTGGLWVPWNPAYAPKPW